MGSDAGETWLKMGDAHRMLAPLGISEQTVRNWADSGRLKSKRLGPGGRSGHRRIAKSSVDAELAAFLADDHPPSDDGYEDETAPQE